MKKWLCVFTLVTIFAAGTAFADHPDGFGIGVQFGGGGSWSGGGFGASGIALSLKIPSVPVFWTINLDIFNDAFGLGVAGDYFLIDKVLVTDIKLHWYLGLGGGVDIWFGDTLGLGASARLPIGLSWQPLDLLDVYLQIVPNIGVAILPDFHFPYGGYGGNLGIRIWL